jgi:alkylation response protein AidB-like acyl-CoA dehydrogenase
MPSLDATVFNKSMAHLTVAYHGPYLPGEWETLLKREGWFRLFLPRALDGLQLRLHEGLELLVETATVQGSLGWRINLGAGAGFFAGSMPEDTAAEIYGKPESLISGSGAVSGKAQRVNGGYLLSGHWLHCTGATQATAFTFNARTEEGKILTFIVKPENVSVRRHWPYWALKSTETYAVEVKEAFIPEDYVFEIGVENHFSDYRLYDLDFMAFARACMTASFTGMALGTAQHALNEFTSSRYSALNSCAQSLRNKALSLKSALLAAAENLESMDKLSSEKELRNRLLAPMEEVLECSWWLFKEGGLELCREDCLTLLALKDFWLASRHFLTR